MSDLQQPVVALPNSSLHDATDTTANNGTPTNNDEPSSHQLGRLVNELKDGNIKELLPACKAFTYITTNFESQRKFCEAGGVEALTCIITRHLDGERELLEYACHVLRNVTTGNSAQTKAYCASSGAAQALVNVLKRHGTTWTLDLALHATAALCNITSSANSFVALDGGIEALLDVIKFWGNHELLMHACKTLRNLTMKINAESQRKFCEAGGVKALTCIITRHLDGERELLEYACHVLRNVTTGNSAQTKAYCASSGAAQALVNVLKGPRAPWNFDLALHATAALCNITSGANSPVALDGGIEALLDMFKVWGNTKLLMHACKTLRNLTMTIDFESGRTFGKAGGVQALTCILERYLDGSNNELLLDACTVLGNVTTNADNQRKFGKAGGVKVVVDLIKRKREVVALVVQAFKVLANIAVDAENQHKCRDAGGIDVAVKLIKLKTKWPDELQKQACLALSNITMLDYDNKRHCGQVGGIEALVDLLTLYRDNCTGLLEAACKALFSACNVPNELGSYRQEAQIRCADVGGVEALMEIIRAYKGKPASLVEAACAALWIVIRSNRDNQIRCGNDGGAYVLVPVIKHYVAVNGPMDLLTNACGALGSYTQLIVDNQIACFDAGAIKALATVLERYLATAPHALLEQACFAWLNISRSNLVKLGQTPGDYMLEQLVAKRFKDAPSIVLRLACRTMKNMIPMDDDDAKTLFGVCGGVAALVALVNYRHDDTFILQTVCDLLLHVAININNKNLFKIAGGVEVMENLLTLRTDSLDRKVINEVLTAMVSVPGAADGQVATVDVAAAATNQEATVEAECKTEKEAKTEAECNTNKAMQPVSVPISEAIMKPFYVPIKFWFCESPARPELEQLHQPDTNNNAETARTPNSAVDAATTHTTGLTELMEVVTHDATTKVEAEGEKHVGELEGSSDTATVNTPTNLMQHVVTHDATTKVEAEGEKHVGQLESTSDAATVNTTTDLMQIVVHDATANVEAEGEKHVGELEGTSDAATHTTTLTGLMDALKRNQDQQDALQAERKTWLKQIQTAVHEDQELLRSLEEKVASQQATIEQMTSEIAEQAGQVAAARHQQQVAKTELADVYLKLAVIVDGQQQTDK